MCSSFSESTNLVKRSIRELLTALNTLGYDSSSMVPGVSLDINKPLNSMYANCCIKSLSFIIHLPPKLDLQTVTSYPYQSDRRKSSSSKQWTYLQRMKGPAHLLPWAVLILVPLPPLPHPLVGEPR